MKIKFKVLTAKTQAAQWNHSGLSSAYEYRLEYWALIISAAWKIVSQFDHKYGIL
jgi:hypothetical protein